MFTGIVTDVGEVRSVTPRADNLHRITIATRYPRAGWSSWRLDRLLGRVPDRGRHRRGGRPHLVRGRCRRRNARAHDRRHDGGTARASISSARSRSATNSAAISSPAMSTDSPPCSTREDMTDMARFTLRAPHALTRFIAPKGSVALDGVSLTVNTVEDDDFSVLIIPHTLAVTTLGALRAGDPSISKSTPWRATRARLMEAKSSFRLSRVRCCPE